MNSQKVNISIATWLLFGIFALVQLSRLTAQTPTKSAQQPTQTPAQSEQKVNAEQVDKTEKSVPSTAEDFFSAGENVEVKSESVVGDVAVAGANVKIAGKVEGYLLAAGANVNIDAPIGNDLWAAGANVVVNAPVADNTMLAGNSVVLEKNATIGRDARIGANSAEVKGRVARNLNISATNAQISSEVGGNVVAFAENLTLNPGAIVRGDLTVHSPNQPTISPQAQVLGRVDYHKTERSQSAGSTVSNKFSSWFLTFLWITMLGLIAVWFSSLWTKRVAETLKQEMGKSALVGFIVALLVPIVFALLLVTVVGLPLAFVVGAMTLMGFMFSGVFVAYLVGDWFLEQLQRWQNSNALKIIFGALLITIVMSLPWIGWLVSLAVFFFGFGAFLLERQDFIHKLREQGLA